MRIPTLLGVAVIFALITSLGVYYYFGQDDHEEYNLEISDLKVVNITDTSATIAWQSSVPARGEILYSDSENLSKKAADQRTPADINRSTHFVTINDLKPDTKYFYKTKNDSFIYPPKPLQFKTAKFSNNNEELTFSFSKPLKGTVLNTNLNPTDESLIYLNIPGAQEIGAFSSTAGNFVLPLKSVLSKELDKQFIIEDGTTAQLTIVKNNLKSNIKIVISQNSINLPPITVGSNLDLINYSPTQIKKITFSERQSQGLDFNGDGAINSLDLAQLREAVNLPGANNTQSQSKFDVNLDGVIDQKDVEGFSEALSES